MLSDGNAGGGAFGLRGPCGARLCPAPGGISRSGGTGKDAQG